ncbi:MAG TPA: hypothetical protein VLT84_10210 [Acidobacteriota bacterium]|nr:hypothetical protein [Acidobacteriota bacterium]
MRSALLAVFILLAACPPLGPGGALAQPADSAAAQPAAPPAPPPARKIPGITAADQFANGCVGCHVNMPEQNLDTRFSTLLAGWGEKVEPALLAKAQAAAPAGVTLKGTHPAAKASLKDIPAGCIKCHGAASKKAPPFARLIHRIHLIGGDENHFMTIFQGECTHCHKLDATTGAWSVPSAPEP